MIASHKSYHSRRIRYTQAIVFSNPRFKYATFSCRVISRSHHFLSQCSGRIDITRLEKRHLSETHLLPTRCSLTASAKSHISHGRLPSASASASAGGNRSSVIANPSNHPFLTASCAVVRHCRVKISGATDPATSSVSAPVVDTSILSPRHHT